MELALVTREYPLVFAGAVTQFSTGVPVMLPAVTSV
jgi:hypothetical protein